MVPERNDLTQVFSKFVPFVLLWIWGGSAVWFEIGFRSAKTLQRCCSIVFRQFGLDLEWFMRSEAAQMVNRCVFFFYFPFAAFLDFQFPVPFRILGVRSSPSQVTDIWEFPKISGTLFGGPCYKDITI